jgi:hypothetical protein
MWIDGIRINIRPEDKCCRFWRPEQEDEIRYEWIITFG